MIQRAFAQEGIVSAVGNFIPGGIENILNFGLGIGAILALGTVVYAGILYSMAGDSSSKQKEARSWIWSAVQGLLLIAFGYVILNIINPNIVKIREEKIEPVKEIPLYRDADDGQSSVHESSSGTVHGGGGRSW
jgi:hypothetical protein